MQFGILNNQLAQRAGVPHLKLPQGVMSEESEWVYFWRDAVHRMPGRTAALSGTVTPDANPIIRYHLHESLAGLLYFFAFTADHIYLWDNSNTEWDLMFTCSGSCTHWSVADFDQYVVATNNVDKVQYWDDASPASLFDNLGSANGIDYDGSHYLTKAKYVIRHWNYLHLLSTYEDGTEYPENDRWCSAGDITDWDTSGAGDTNYRQLAAGDRIRGAAIYDVNGANQLLVFTQHSVNAAWLITGDEVYESQDILNHGTIGQDSIVTTPDGDVFYISVDSNRQREVRQIGVSNPLDYDIRPTLATMHPTLDLYVRGGYVGKLRQIWWSIPETGASTANDTTLVLSLDTNLWQPNLPIGISAFGTYTAQDTTYIDDMSDIIDTVVDTIDSFAPVTGDSLFIVADYSGYTYLGADGTQDAGSDFTGSLVLATDFTPEGGGWNQYKRLHGAWLFFESRPGTSDQVTLSLRKGDEDSYANLGTVSLDGDGQTVRQWLRFDKRLRDGHLKLAASNGFAFLGILFELDYTGARL